ncbi:MAG: SsrA-binding protein SmpB [Candidatus Pacebacteria bacterium]|nr:SsrA-binding protein SmpB [Candidatus Paceibacterota bacterium]
MSLVDSKKAGFNYELGEKYEAGIELLGHEVKSVRAGHGILAGAYVKIRGGEAYLVGAAIPPYQPGNTPVGYDPERSRRLLLTKHEIKVLADLDRRQGLTLVPLALYNKGRVIKLSFALAKHKKKSDKREAIKKKDVARDIERSLKSQQ